MPQVARQFDPEDGSDIFFGSKGSNTNYRALYPRKWYHS
jgi:hypothetical protein